MHERGLQFHSRPAHPVKPRPHVDGLVQDFARSAGVSRAYISQLLKGATSPTLGTLEKYAEVLGVDPLFLLEPLNPDKRKPAPMDAELASLVEGLSKLSGNQRQPVFRALRGMLGE